MPSEPADPWGERLRALPYFIYNLVPAIRRNWIRLSRRNGVAQAMADDLPRLQSEDPLPDGFAAAMRRPAAVVLDGTGVLLGAIDKNQPGVPAGEAMNPGPQTVRPDMTHALAAQLLRHSPYLLVSTADGRYLGRYVGRQIS
jgi:hypothetical protein